MYMYMYQIQRINWRKQYQYTYYDHMNTIYIFLCIKLASKVEKKGKSNS